MAPEDHLQASLPPERAGGISRRSVLAGLGAASVLAAAGSPARALGEGKKPWRIDVHHHVSPPAFIANIVALKTGQTPLIDWVPQQSIEDMDRGGVEVAVLSVSEPGVWYGDNAAARHLARSCNEYTARIAGDHPGRFGSFASVPLPDIDGSLAEIAYSLDVLHAQGICLLTSYAGKYLGHPAFDPVMAELGRRGTAVFVHPVRPSCCRGALEHVAPTIVEMPTDTTRAIANLLVHDTAARYRGIRFIFSHAGGTLPMVATRIRDFVLSTRTGNTPRHEPLGEMRRFHFDTAQAFNPYALAALTRLVPATRIVFGTDFPFMSAEKTARGLREFGFSHAQLRLIERDNALALLPALLA
jgi:predicted TIM-barrel fold metal-dependent hydrolase